MPGIWVAALGRIALALGAGALVGWFYGSAAAGALLVALALLAWQLRNLYRLERWLLTGASADIPEGEGIWAAIFAKIQFIKSRAKRRGKRFRKLVKELRASTEAFPDGGVILNSAHEILNYNQAASRLLGLRPRRDRGLRIDTLVRHPDFVRYIEQADPRATVEIPSPVSAATWLSCRLIPYGPDQRLLMVRDISERVRIEKVRRDFVANASHELRSPLTVIVGYLDTLAEDQGAPDAWRGPVLEMRESAIRMQRLVEDLLQLSRLESGQAVSKDRPVDVALLLEMARREALALPGHPARVEVRLNSEAKLLGDEGQLHSVVSNLVSNAARYTPADGSVLISWDVDEEGGRLSVKDTGIGIAPEDLPRITERFYRADAGRARQKGGTGLGLAIVKYALRRHDAELEIKSRVGAGSTFTCHFPRDRIALP